MHLPLTGSLTNDFIVAALVLIGGVGLALKADVKFGWVVVAAALFWGFLLLKPFAGH